MRKRAEESARPDKPSESVGVEGGKSCAESSLSREQQARNARKGFHMLTKST